MTRRKLLSRVAIFVILGIVVLFLSLSLNALRIAGVQSDLVPPDQIDIDSDNAVLRLAQAIQFRTLSEPPGIPVDPSAFVAFRHFLNESFPLVRDNLQLETINDFSLIYCWRGTDVTEKPILLVGHQDVVPPNGEWSRPPFSGLVEGGFVWGRGALDDKVGVLGILEAVEFLLASGFEPRRTIYLAFGHDEEIDGKNGAQAIAHLFHDRDMQFSFVLDEGSPIGIGLVPGLNRPVALIGTSEKGYLSVELVARTSGGHSSIPSRASAMRVMSEALVRLWEASDEVTLDPSFSDTLDAVAPHLGFVERLLLANRWLFEPILVDQLMRFPEARAMMTTTGTVTIIEAGEIDNMMPSRARAVINLRLMPGTTVDNVLARMREVIDDPALSVEQFGEAIDPSPISDPSSYSYGVISDTVRQVFPDTIVVPSLVLAATDARHYVSVADQVYRFLPTRLAAEDLSRMHGVDERISITNYTEIIRFYAQLILNAAR